MKTKLNSFWVLLVVLAAIFFMQTKAAWALPANSRVYQTSCVTCHDSPPRLNAVGEAFRLNGYKFPDDETKRKLKPLPLGDEAYQRLWPEAIWPGEKPDFNPISLVSIWALEYHDNQPIDPKTGEEGPTYSIVAPHEIELAWMSPLGDHISVYGDARFIQEDWGGTEMDSWVALKAWIEFEDLFGIENKLNLRVGSLGMHSIHLLTARNEHAMGFQNYLMNTYLLPGLSKSSRTTVDEYPQSDIDEVDFDIRSWVGNNFTIGPKVGIELNGFTRHLAYNIGVVNGKTDDPTDGVFFMGSGSNTGRKDYFANLAIKFGGLGFDASTGAEEEEDPFAEETAVKKESGDSQFWRDDSLTVSFMGYRGEGATELIYYSNSATAMFATGQVTEYVKEDFWRLGVGAMWKFKDLTVEAAHMWGHHDNPYGDLDTRPDPSVETRVWHVGAHYYLYPWLVPFARFEELKFFDLPGQDVLLLDVEQDRQLVTVGAKMQIRPNIHLNIEGYYYTDTGDATVVNPDSTKYIGVSEEAVYLNDETVMMILRAEF
ncbi:MAG: hypothetical protein RI601_00270 [Desulfurivibrionaceae bacterium]|nr:hypothetical protein [Desulfurivibrionaceae bacterium]